MSPDDFKPDESVVSALLLRVPELFDGSGVEERNVFAGNVNAYGLGVQQKIVFVLANGGLSSRPIRFNSIVQELHPRVDVYIRSDSSTVTGAFKDGQTLARKVFFAMNYSPPAGYCECISLNSQAAYLGKNEDGHHEWMVSLQMTADVGDGA